MKAFLLVAAAVLSMYGTFSPAVPNTATYNATAAQAQNTPEIKPLSLAQVIDTCVAFYGVPREVIIGVAYSETGIGKAGVGKPEAANGIFGVRKGKYDKHPKDMVYTCSNGSFRKYATPQEAVPDFCRFIQQYYTWFFTKPRPVERWLLNGYGNSKYEVRGYFLQFKDYKV